MRGLGTIVNISAVLVGSMAGVVAGGRLLDLRRIRVASMLPALLVTPLPAGLFAR